MAAGFQWDAEKGELQWPDHIQSEQAKQAFREHCKKRFTSENINFLEELEKANKNEDFLKIYNKYIPENSENQINIDGGNREHLEKSVGSLNKASFNNAASEIANLITNDLLKDFKPPITAEQQPTAEQSEAKSESKGFLSLAGSILKKAGELLLSGVKEVGKFLFSPASSAGISSGDSFSATEMLFNPTRELDKVDAKTAFNKNWGPEALNAVENLNKARREGDTDEVEKATAALLKIITDKQSDNKTFLKGFKEAYPVKYKEYEDAKSQYDASSQKKGERQAATAAINAGSPTVTPAQHQQTEFIKAEKRSAQNPKPAQQDTKISSHRPGKS